MKRPPKCKHFRRFQWINGDEVGVKFTVTNHLQTNEWRICCGAHNTDPLDHLNQYLKERLSTLIPGTLNRDFNNHCESNLESFPWNLSLFLFLIATKYNLKPHRITAVSINSDPIKSTSQALETLSGTRSMLCQSKWQQQEESIQYSDFN